MAAVSTDLIAELQARGLISQMSGDGELEKHLAEGARTIYCGFDPTADSLHIGSLVPLLTLKRFQMAGHKPVALVGGATGLIGDPSFKAQERKLQSQEVVSEWVDKIRDQVSRFIDFDCGESSAQVVNNLDWIGSMDLLSFLRDVGKHFAVNAMIHKESVKQRLDREGEGISYTEFTYLLLQSYDFAELYKDMNCTVQIGGSDQWGNITGGIDLARRMHGGQVFGMTLPLVTKADGSKFGKTESGTVWLDPERTSPYAFYQFWLNTADADVYKFLKYFTFISPERIDEIEAEDREAQGRPQAQRILAEEVTRLIHGEEGLTAAQRITDSLFSGEAGELSAEDFAQLQLDGLPTAEVKRSELEGVPLTQLLSDIGMVNSGKQVKDALGRQSVYINGRSLGMDDNMLTPQCFAEEQSRFGQYYLIKLGKKKYHLVVAK